MRQVPNKNQEERVVVIGGGAIGLSVAYYLAKDGSSVILLESRGLGSEASGANVGLVMVSSKPPGPLFELARESGRMYQTLGQELGYEIYYRRIGSLTIFPDEEAEEAGLMALAVQRDELGLDVKLLTKDETLALEPVLSPTIRGSICSGDDGALYPLALIQGLSTAARRLGVDIRTGVEASRIVVSGGRVVGVKTGGGVVEASTVVIAAGVWSSLIKADVNLHIPVFPVQGQMLVTEKAPPVIRHVIMGGEPSARQTPFGNIVIGSTPQLKGFDKNPDRETLREYATGILRLFPGLRQLQIIRTWANLRPATEDGLPIVGWAPGVKGLMLATGHFRNGVCYAPATGRAVADLITRGKTFAWVKAFSPDRFALQGQPT